MTILTVSAAAWILAVKRICYIIVLTSQPSDLSIFVRSLYLVDDVSIYTSGSSDGYIIAPYVFIFRQRNVMVC